MRDSSKESTEKTEIKIVVADFWGAKIRYKKSTLDVAPLFYKKPRSKNQKTISGATKSYPIIKI